MALFARGENDLIARTKLAKTPHLVATESALLAALVEEPEEDEDEDKDKDEDEESDCNIMSTKWSN